MLSGKKRRRAARAISSGRVLTEVVDVDGIEATRYRCPPGSNRGGDFTNVQGTTCNLAPSRETIADVSEGALSAARIGQTGKPKPMPDAEAAPSPSGDVRKRGARDVAINILDRFAKRVRPKDEPERRRSMSTTPPKPDGPTSGDLPQRQRIQTDVPEKPKPPTGPTRAAGASVDEANKQNIRNNGKKVPGSQFGQNFGNEEAAKKQAVDAAKAYKKQIFIVKNDNAARRPYRVVDEDRAIVAKTGTIVGVVDEDGNYKSIDALGMKPKEFIDEFKKDPDFGKPQGPNSPQKPPSEPKVPSGGKPDRSLKNPTINDITEEEKELLSRMADGDLLLYTAQIDAIDSFVAEGSLVDIYEMRKNAERDKTTTVNAMRQDLKGWREGDDSLAFDWLAGNQREGFEHQLVKYADNAINLAKANQKAAQDARREIVRLEAEREEIERRASELDVDKPEGPRPVGVGEIFGAIEADEPTVPPELMEEAKSLLAEDSVEYKADRFDVSHGNSTIYGYNIPEEVPDGNAGIGSAEEAIEHLLGGGSLDEVPDKLLRSAILDTTDDPRFGKWTWPDPTASPRFKILVDDPGNGINNQSAATDYAKTYIVEDLKTGRKYIVKTPQAFQDEYASEVYGQFFQQVLGTHSARIRVGGFDPINSANGALPIVMEHFDDVLEGGVDGDGKDLTFITGVQDFYLSDTQFKSVSRDMILLMDSVMENSDRHWQNWLFQGDPYQKMTVVGIDNGASNAYNMAGADVDQMKATIFANFAYATDELAMKQILERMDIDKALAALDVLDDRVAGPSGMALRHLDSGPDSRQRTLNELSERIRNFLAAVEQIRTNWN